MPCHRRFATFRGGAAHLRDDLRRECFCAGVRHGPTRVHRIDQPRRLPQAGGLVEKRAVAGQFLRIRGLFRWSSRAILVRISSTTSHPHLTPRQGTLAPALSSRGRFDAAWASRPVDRPPERYLPENGARNEAHSRVEPGRRLFL